MTFVTQLTILDYNFGFVFNRFQQHLDISLTSEGDVKHVAQITSLGAIQYVQHFHQNFLRQSVGVKWLTRRHPETVQRGN
ncbi:hypothetical protein O3P69_002231 [Scylla paramamosain]|uniref:Uncharacterized protein n=1 Tax=Scylla paramamosain TaxID=85552 RepID=A0AAW0V7A4_SCYPA